VHRSEYAPAKVTERPDAVLGATLLSWLLCAAAQSADRAPEPARESQSMKAVCGRCHDLQIVRDTPKSYDDWHDTVQKMVDRGASGTDEQFEDIMDYLHRTITTINVNTAVAEELEIVLNVPETTAQAIIARRSTQKFTGLADLKSAPGVDASAVDAKARLIFFNQH
jgi:competence protein ComEA